MRRLVYLTAARDDLINILRYVATGSGSPEVARSFVSRLQEKCRHLAGLPGTLRTAGVLNLVIALAVGILARPAKHGVIEKTISGEQSRSTHVEHAV